ncbi:hypothetical protein B0G93_12111 [Bacillus sp. V-88]|nr:hypothetical protein B1B00_16865 [Bacillus sp. DSM 27956]PRX72848.1 hypothetical protein B0G93_12111 [Bacillus sp. V-88]SLK24199.1 hypothetical protein SAMN06295884_12111 [Bacillus sp. V-88]
MEILLLKFLSDFIKTIEKNPIESFIYLSLIILFVWFFKHYKELFSNNELDQRERTLKKLEFFGLLESYLTLYIKNPSESSREKISELIGKSYPYIDQEARTKLIEIINRISYEQDIDPQLKWITEQVTTHLKSNERKHQARIADRLESVFVLILSPLFYALISTFVILFLISVSLEIDKSLESYLDGLILLILFLCWILLIDEISINFKLKRTLKLFIVSIAVSLTIVILTFQPGLIWSGVSVLIFIFIFFKIVRSKKQI